MRVRFENLGPLREAEIDLSKRLLVLTGPNNTGKTYVAWATYGLHRYRPTSLPLIEKWAMELLENGELSTDSLISEHQKELIEGLALEYSKQIHKCFGGTQQDFSGFRLSIDAAPSLIPHTMPRLHFATVPNVIYTKAYWQRMQAMLRSTIGENLYTSLLGVCDIFPAERIAVSLFSKELAANRAELIDELIDSEQANAQQGPVTQLRQIVGRYPWPIRDALWTDVRRAKGTDGAFSHLAQYLSDHILGGQIGISEDQSFYFAPASAPERKLGLHMSSSVVKSLASLVHYFRYEAGAGAFLIIDEPELNLHPDAQRRMAWFLAKAVRAGFRLMISTHSDILLRELNHLIMLSKLSDEEAKEVGYDPECALAPEQVGVYLFNHGTAEAVPIDDMGFSVETIDAVNSAMNRSTQRLYAKLDSKDAGRS